MGPARVPAARQVTLIDLHNDVAMKLLAHGVSMQAPAGRLDIDMEGIRARRPDALVFAAYSDPHFTGADAEALVSRQLELLLADIARPGSLVEPAFSVADLRRITAAGRTAAILGVEGGYAITDRLEPLERLHAKGARLLTLTHSRATSWAGADTDGAAMGLTPFGEGLVRRMNELGMIVDVAHTSTETILAAARVSRRPIVFSHGGVRSLAKSRRAIADEAIRAVAGTGGVVGVSFFPLHLAPGEGDSGWSVRMLALEERAGEIMRQGRGDATATFIQLAKLFGDAFPVPPPEARPDLTPLLDTIDHVNRVAGEDFVALGSDFDGIAYTVRGLENFSRIDRLASALAGRGHPAERIAKVMGGNARRVIDAVLP